MSLDLLSCGSDNPDGISCDKSFSAVGFTNWGVTLQYLFIIIICSSVIYWKKSAFHHLSLSEILKYNPSIILLRLQ